MTCAKMRYRDKGSALLALADIDTADKRIGKKECRAYRCPRCKGWHLTAQASRRARRFK